MGEIGRDHWGDHLVQPLCSPMAQDCIQVVLPSGGDSRPSLGSLSPAHWSSSSFSGRNSWPSAPAHCLLSHCWAPGAEPGFCSDPFLETLTHRDEVTSSGCTAPVPSAFPHERCSSPLMMGSHPLAAFVLPFSNGSRVMAAKSYTHPHPKRNTAYFVYLQ